MPENVKNEATNHQAASSRPFSYSAKSAAKLATCHPDLQRLFRTVLPKADHTILEGHRTRARQERLVAAGASTTMHSRHFFNPSRAVDAAPYPIDWNDIPRFEAFGQLVKNTAQELGIAIRWGGDWKTFKDYVHFELTVS